MASALCALPSRADAEKPRVPLAKRPLFAPSTGPTRTIVKFTDDAEVRLGADGLYSKSGRALQEVARLVHARGLVLEPVFDDVPGWDRLAARASARSGRAQPDLGGMFEVTGGTLDDARALQVLAAVEFVSITAVLPPEPLDLDPPTPDLSEFQTYLGPDPGVDAFGAWAQGYRGASVRLSDLEYAWLPEHEEWNEGTLIPEPNQTTNFGALEGIADGNHGTAVAGQLIGGDNGYGVTGITPDAVLGVYPTLTVENGYRRPEAIAAAAMDSAPGDVLLYEMQVGENITGQLGPAELDEAVWITTRMVVDAGMVVVAAAGNGDLDLDREELAYYRNRGDSGAIIVGAGGIGNRERLGFSTYGTRVDVQGWGEAVFTTGYGVYEAYGDDPNQSYTNIFAGTSSASPIVAGVAALVQDAVKANGNEPLTSAQMRAVLRGTGLPQPEGDTGNIGPLPQAPAAIAAALIPQTEPPTVTIINPGSTQTEETTLATTIDVDASSDTARVQLSINGELQPVIDDVPPFSFAEVVFPAGTWEVVAVATNIWDNEASSEVVTLEVGYEPPAGSTSGMGDSSSGGGVGTGADATDGDEPPSDSTTGTPPPSAASSSSGGDDPSASGGGGGCSTGHSSGAPLLLFSLLALRRRRARGPGAR
ncbi:MAG: S8 family serine peptidase [Myxococcota bacterium]